MVSVRFLPLSVPNSLLSEPNINMFVLPSVSLISIFAELRLLRRGERF